MTKRFRVSSTLEREVVLLPAQPTEEDARALAVALHAKVSKPGERWLLERDGPLRRDLAQKDRAELKRRIDQVSSRVQDLAHRYERSPEQAPFQVLTASRAHYEAQRRVGLDTSGLAAQEAAPAARLLVDLLKRIPIDSTSQMKPGRSTVLSTGPVGQEGALKEADAPLAAYARAQEAFTDWSFKATGEGRIEENDRWIFPQGPFRLGPRTAVVTFDRCETEPSFALQVFDVAGRCESNAVLPANGFGRESAVVRKTPPLGIAPLPTEAATLIERASKGEENRSEVVDPAARDPLDLFVRDALLLYARARGFERAIACVPDDLFRSVQGSVREGTIDLDALGTILQRSGVEEIPAGRSLVLRPALALEEEAIRVDRRPLSLAVRQARDGRFGFDELCRLHADYAQTYEHRPFLWSIVRPIAHAFRWNEVPGGSFPHSVMAVLGDLDPHEREALASNGLMGVGLQKHLESLSSLAEYAGQRRASPSDDLSATPTHILASLEGVMLEAIPGQQTLVKRVSRQFAVRTIIDGATGEARTEKGENLVLDDDFVPIDSLLPGTRPEAWNGYRLLDKRYRFLWSQEDTLRFSFALAPSTHLGPFVLHRPVRTSTKPTPLDQVPGLQATKPSP